MNILIMGPAGAGKGTMSELILKAYDIPHISTGDMLRENVRNNTELGKLAKTYMEKQGGGMEYYNENGFVVELLLRKV